MEVASKGQHPVGGGHSLPGVGLADLDLVVERRSPNLSHSP